MPVAFVELCDTNFHLQLLNQKTKIKQQFRFLENELLQVTKTGSYKIYTTQ